MAKISTNEDPAFYESLASRAPMGVCPERSTKINPSAIAAEVGNFAVDNSSLQDSLAVSIEPIGYDHDRPMPTGTPREVSIDIQNC